MQAADLSKSLYELVRLSEDRIRMEYEDRLSSFTQQLIILVDSNLSRSKIIRKLTQKCNKLAKSVHLSSLPEQNATESRRHLIEIDNGNSVTSRICKECRNSLIFSRLCNENDNSLLSTSNRKVFDNLNERKINSIPLYEPVLSEESRTLRHDAKYTDINNDEADSISFSNIHEILGVDQLDVRLHTNVDTNNISVRTITYNEEAIQSIVNSSEEKIPNSSSRSIETLNIPSLTAQSSPLVETSDLVKFESAKALENDQLQPNVKSNVIIESAKISRSVAEIDKDKLISTNLKAVYKTFASPQAISDFTNSRITSESINNCRRVTLSPLVSTTICEEIRQDVDSQATSLSEANYNPSSKSNISAVNKISIVPTEVNIVSHQSNLSHVSSSNDLLSPVFTEEVLVQTVSANKIKDSQKWIDNKRTIDSGFSFGVHSKRQRNSNVDFAVIENGNDENKIRNEGYNRVDKPSRANNRKDGLPGHTCDECRDFYEALVEQGVVSEESMNQMLQNCSRHKHGYSPPPTPEGFWDLDIETPAAWK